MLIDDSEAIQNEVKEQKDEFLGILLGKLSANLLGSKLAAGKKVIWTGEVWSIIKAGQDF